MAREMSDDYTTANVPGRLIMEKDAEITRLRAELAAVTEERDRMREALRPFAKLKPASWSLEHDIYYISTDDITAVRAAIEGVTEPASPKAETEFFVFDEFAPLPEPASPWRDIESAPKDGTYIDLWANNERISDARWNDRQRRWEAWSLGDYDGMEFISIAGNPTHWMPLPEPPK